MGSTMKREQYLILYLSKKQDYVTSQELQDVLHVSQKTIYRLVKKINDAYPDGPLILSTRGRGYKLDYEKFISGQNRHPERKNDISPGERRKRVMEELLLSSTKSIPVHHLYSDFYVGDSVITHDEQIMEEKLKKYHLVLERKNRTLAILGDEVNVRRAIIDVIEIFNTIDIDDLKSNPELNFNRYDVLFILDQIRTIEKELDITLPYPYNVNIFSHLYILLSRMRKIPALQVTGGVSTTEMEKMRKDKLLYLVAKRTVNRIERYLNRPLPEIEIYFLYQYFVSSRMQGSATPEISTFSPDVIRITRAYIDGMSAHMGVNIDGHFIFNDLAHHIKPMLNRLKFKIHIKNSLLSQIKVTYGDVFSNVKKVSQWISEKFNLPPVSDDENGFITLYFAKVFITGQHQRPIKTLIMCTTGIGTSELLKAKVAKKFPELEIVDVVSSRDMNMIKEKYGEVELILSTVNGLENCHCHYLVVSALFTNDDQRRLQRKIEEIYYERK